MSPRQMRLENSFWKFLVSLEELKEKKEMILFCSSLGTDEDAIKEYCIYLRGLDIDVNFDDQFIYPLKDQCRIKVEFSVSEWFAMEAMIHENQAKEQALYFNQVLATKFKTIQRLNKRSSLYDLDEVKPIEKSHSFNKFENLKKKIDYFIAHKKLMTITFAEEKSCEVFPHRQVFLDGVLCVVGENVKDKTLCYFAVEDVFEIDELKIQYEPNLSQIEINEFVCHLRLINGREERLVLKIYSQEEADLLPQYHFLGNPFVTSNTEGDMIWAATIEMCDEVFHWLYKMRDRVEILDPGHIRKDFAHYCELKKENESEKKAS